MKKIDKKQTDEFYTAVLKLESKEEVRNFFEDICSIAELSALSQRLRVASLLKKGMSYLDISKETGASTATICRVNKCLSYGAGGVDAVLEKTKK